MNDRDEGVGSVLTATSRLIADLSPVVNYLSDRARRRAAQLSADAAAQGEATIAEARRQADVLLTAARESGAALARRGASDVVANARREAREQVLGAQRLVYEQTRTQARERLRGFANSPEAGALNARLAIVARQCLGDEATVTTPDGEVGVIAYRDERRLDLSTDALVERTLVSAGEELAELWS